VGVVNAAGTGFGEHDAHGPGAVFAGFDLAEGIADQARRDHAVPAHGGVLADIGRGQQFGSAVNAQRHIDRVRIQPYLFADFAHPVDEPAHHNGNAFVGGLDGLQRVGEAIPAVEYAKYTGIVPHAVNHLLLADTAVFILMEGLDQQVGRILQENQFQQVLELGGDALVVPAPRRVDQHTVVPFKGFHASFSVQTMGHARFLLSGPGPGPG